MPCFILLPYIYAWSTVLVCDSMGKSTHWIHLPRRRRGKKWYLFYSVFYFCSKQEFANSILKNEGKNLKLKLFCSKTHRLSWGQEQRINDNSRKNNKSTKLLLLLLLLQTVFTLYNHVIVLSIETLFQMYFTTACTAWRLWESNSNEQKKMYDFSQFFNDCNEI